MSEQKRVRSDVPAQLRPETKQLVDTLTADIGTTQIELLARLVDWFASQPDAVRVAILRRQDVAELFWRLKQQEKLTKEQGGGVDVSAATQQLRDLADLFDTLDRGGGRKGKGK